MSAPLGGEGPACMKTATPPPPVFPIPFGWSFSIAPLSQPCKETGPKFLADTAYSTTEHPLRGSRPGKMDETPFPGKMDETIPCLLSPRYRWEKGELAICCWPGKIAVNYGSSRASSAALASVQGEEKPYPQAWRREAGVLFPFAHLMAEITELTRATRPPLLLQKPTCPQGQPILVLMLGKALWLLAPCRGRVC